MDVRRIRAELRAGRSIYDLPLRVTFYARVSTDQDEQINSLENQVQYYTELIQSKPNWRFVPGYIDEGISGGTTKKRDDFNRMIRDAKAGMFDFIITKEISRFSRSTLDSIKYTQELLENNVGVLFQNDNINTLDTDSEFRLVIMAGVAQDEIRKLSERLKFGFRQAIKNGHVLGNDKLYGYDKKDCVLSINEEEAEIIRIIFDLYANQKLGTRSISKKLTEMGYTSREGNAFNTLTIRHILENPKYKGWYCGNKTSSLDYRTKKKAFLDESEWVMYPDPAIPAIVSEELWDRANALYKKRREETMSHSSGVSFQNRYPYSAKIICEEHGTTFHRQVLENKKGKQEVWQCKVYRSHGRSGCSAPQIRSSEVDAILTEIFKELMKDKQAIIDSLVKVITSVPKEVDYDRLRSRVQEEMDEIEKKKDRLLDLSIAGALDVEEFKKRNDALNVRLRECESQLSAIRQEEERAVDNRLNEAEIRRVLDRELSFEGEPNSALLTTILKKIVVKKGSTKEEIHLDVYLKLGQQYEAIYSPGTLPTSINRLKKDERIRVIHKKNGGLSDARNAGIACATGEFLAFIDSDDWYDRTMLETLHSLCEQYQADISECSYRSIWKDSIQEETSCSGAVFEFTPAQAIESNLDWKYCKPVAWNKLYRKKIVKDIRFPVGKLHEDEFTTHLFYLASSKIVYADIALVNYERRNVGSITASFKPKNLDAVEAFLSKTRLTWEIPELQEIAEKAGNNYCYVLLDRVSKCEKWCPECEELPRTVRDAYEAYEQLVDHGLDPYYIPKLEELFVKFGLMQLREDGAE